MSERVHVGEFAEALGPGWTQREVVAAWAELGLKPVTDWAGRASITGDEAGRAYATINTHAAEAAAEVEAALAERRAQRATFDEYQPIRDEVERRLYGYVSGAAILDAQRQAVERIRRGEEPGSVVAEVVLANRLPVQAQFIGR